MVAVDALAPLRRLHGRRHGTLAEVGCRRHHPVDRSARKKGLCRCTRSTEDRRVVRIKITAEGLAAAAQAPAVLSDIMNAHLAGFTESEWKQLLTLLRRMRDNP